MAVVDLQHVDVQAGDIEAAAVGFKSASGFFRSSVAEHLKLRVVPQLVFSFDEALEHGARIHEILAAVNREGEGSE